MFRSMTAVLTLLLALPFSVGMQAQETQDQRETSTPQTSADEEGFRLFEPWVKVNGLFFENFFQAPDGEPSENVAAAQGEIGTSIRLSRTNPLRAYASANYVAWDEDALDSANGFRVGLRSQARPHSFDVYADMQRDNPTFDVGDEFARADIATLAGEYSYRFTRDWQVGIDGLLQRQETELAPQTDNDFRSVGAAVRYRGWKFSPELGFRTGEREVERATDSYDQDEIYLQVRSSLTPDLYLSVRLRNRTRDYITRDPLASNFGREDDRRQITASLDWRFAPRLTWSFYGSHERVDVNRENRDFDTSLLSTGLTYRF